MENKIQLLSDLLREYEAEIGMNDLNIVVLESLIKAINNFRISSVKIFSKQFDELRRIFTNTEPKYGILNYHFAELNKIIKKCCKNEKKYKTVRKWKKSLVTAIRNFIKDSKRAQREIIKIAEKIDVEGKTILIHDHSHTVQDVIRHFKAMGRHFNVIIAEQEYDKTHASIEKMHKLKIPFQVVPSYMLSHIHDSVDMLFFGALTLKDTMVFVMDPGTHGVITEFHADNTPIYMFLNTYKFSLWKSKKRDGVFMHRHRRRHHAKHIEYERIKYSHDRVPVTFFKQIITNEGIFDAKKLKTLFNKKLREYNKLH